MKLIIRYKGGPGSGHFGHSGRAGLIGGSLPAADKGGAGYGSHITEAERLSWYNNVNIALYNKVHSISSAAEDSINNATSSIVYGGISKEEFNNTFFNDQLDVPKAKRGDSTSIENFLFKLKSIVPNLKGSSLVTWSEIEKLLNISEQEFDYRLYTNGLDKYFGWERRFGLNQLRLKNDYAWSEKNGIQSKQSMLLDTIKALGYKNPDKFYDYIQSLR